MEFFDYLCEVEIFVSVFSLDVWFRPNKGSSLEEGEEKSFLLCVCLVVWIVCDFESELHEKGLNLVSISMVWVGVRGFRCSFLPTSYCL